MQLSCDYEEKWDVLAFHFTTNNSHFTQIGPMWRHLVSMEEVKRVVSKYLCLHDHFPSFCSSKRSTSDLCIALILERWVWEEIMAWKTRIHDLKNWRSSVTLLERQIPQIAFKIGFDKFEAHCMINLAKIIDALFEKGAYIQLQLPTCPGSKVKTWTYMIDLRNTRGKIHRNR